MNAPSWPAGQSFIEQLRHAGHPTEVTILHRGRNLVYRTTVGDDDIVVKVFGRGNWFKRASSWLRGDKAQRTVQIIQRFRAAGIDSPEALAACIDCDQRPVLITRCQANLGSVRELAFESPSDERQAGLTALGHFIQQFVNAGLHHQDFNRTNILMVLRSPWHFAIIDCNRVHIGPVTEARLTDMLLRLGFHHGADCDALFAGLTCDAGFRTRFDRRIAWHTWWWRWKSSTRPLRRRLGM